MFTLGDHKDAITGLSWRADSQMLASSSEDGRVILWYAEDGFPTRSINAQADAKAPPGAAGQAARRAVGAVRPQRPARHLRPRQHGPRLEGRRQPGRAGSKASPTCPSRVVFSHDGERVFVGDFTGKVRVWDLKDKKPAGELTTNPE